MQTVHSLFDHTIPICLCDHHPNEMSSHTFKINFTLSGHEHSKQPNMTSWVKINSKKYIIYNIKLKEQLDKHIKLKDKKKTALHEFSSSYETSSGHNKITNVATFIR